MKIPSNRVTHLLLFDVCDSFKSRLQQHLITTPLFQASLPKEVCVPAAFCDAVLIQNDSTARVPVTVHFRNGGVHPKNPICLVIERVM